MRDAIELLQLTKYYGRRRGVIDLEVGVREGEVFGFLGPNGAGKTTTIRLLTGLIRPTSGRATIFGLDTWRDTVAVHRRLAYLGSDPGYLGELTSGELLDHLAALRGLRRGAWRGLVERLELDPTVQIRKLSRGNRQKVGVVQAFMGEEPLLVMDEPTTGLDPLMQRVFLGLVAEARSAGRTVFLSSHNLPEVERSCDRVGIIREGRLIEITTVQTILAGHWRSINLVLGSPVASGFFDLATPYFATQYTLSHMGLDAAQRASRYLESVGARRVAPAPEAVAALEAFDGPLPEDGAAAREVLALLDERGSPATMASAGPRFFGFVIGGSLPVTVAASWLATDNVAGLLQLDAAASKELAAILPGDAGRCAVTGLLGVGLAIAVQRARLRPQLAALLVALVVAVDLARAGVGINRQSNPLVFRVLPGISAERLDDLGGGRVFAVPVSFSRSFLTWLNTRQPDTDLSMAYAMRQELEAYLNVMSRVETAGSQDRTRLSPLYSALGWTGYDRGDVTQFLPLLHHAAVSRILSFDPLEHPELDLRRTVPVGLTGLTLHVYALKHPWPRVLVACRAHRAATRLDAALAPHAATWDSNRDVAFEDPGVLPAAACSTAGALTISRLPNEERYEVESDGPGWLLVRSTHARGWRATLDGHPAALLRADGRHRAVAVPAGRHTVTLRYEPPGLWPGVILTCLSAAAVLWMLAWQGKPGRRVERGDTGRNPVP